MQGLLEFCSEKLPKRGYVVTRSLKDFGIINFKDVETKIMQIPAVLLCYWLGASEGIFKNINE